MQLTSSWTVFRKMTMKTLKSFSSDVFSVWTLNVSDLYNKKEKKINFQEFKIFAPKTHLETERYRFFLDLDGERDDLDLERE